MILHATSESFFIYLHFLILDNVHYTKFIILSIQYKLCSLSINNDPCPIQEKNLLF